MPKESKGATHSYRYAGPATTFRSGDGEKPIGQGDKVTLTNGQIRTLIRLGHRFTAEGKDGESAIAAAQQAIQADRQRAELAARQQQQAGQ